MTINMNVRILIPIIVLFAIACQPENILPEEQISHCEQLEAPSMESKLSFKGNRNGRFMEVPEQTYILHDTLNLIFAPKYEDSVRQTLLHHSFDIQPEGLEILVDSLGEEGWGSMFKLVASQGGSYSISYSAEIDRHSEKDSSHCGVLETEAIDIQIEVIGKIDIIIESVTVDLPNALCDYDFSRDNIKKCPDPYFILSGLGVHSKVSWDYNFQNDGPLTKVLGDTVSVLENYWRPTLYVADEDGLWGHNRNMAGFYMNPKEMGYWETGTYSLGSDVAKWEKGTADITIRRLE